MDLLIIRLAWYRTNQWIRISKRPRSLAIAFGPLWIQFTLPVIEGGTD